MDDAPFLGTMVRFKIPSGPLSWTAYDIYRKREGGKRSVLFFLVCHAYYFDKTTKLNVNIVLFLRLMTYHFIVGIYVSCIFDRNPGSL